MGTIQSAGRRLLLLSAARRGQRPPTRVANRLGLDGQPAEGQLERHGVDAVLLMCVCV